jgi:hypothetical protein
MISAEYKDSSLFNAVLACEVVATAAVCRCGLLSLCDLTSSF